MAISKLLQLLLDDGLEFKERMAQLDGGTVQKILQSRPGAFAEHYYTLVGSRQGDFIVCTAIDEQTQGDPGTVEFDWEAVWKRHVEHKDVVGWFHTHPPGYPSMSGVDKKSFHSWVSALGGTRYAVIACGRKVQAWRMWLERGELCYQQLSADVNIEGEVKIHDPLPQEDAAQRAFESRMAAKHTEVLVAALDELGIRYDDVFPHEGTPVEVSKERVLNVLRFYKNQT